MGLKVVKVSNYGTCYLKNGILCHKTLPMLHWDSPLHQQRRANCIAFSRPLFILFFYCRGNYVERYFRLEQARFRQENQRRSENDGRRIGKFTYGSGFGG